MRRAVKVRKSGLAGVFLAVSAIVAQVRGIMTFVAHAWRKRCDSSTPKAPTKQRKQELETSDKIGVKMTCTNLHTPPSCHVTRMSGVLLLGPARTGTFSSFADTLV